jgi:hypothetical protein
VKRTAALGRANVLSFVELNLERAAKWGNGNDLERTLSKLHAAVDRSPGNLASGAIAHLRHA